jgi:glycosyltransferase involved in cell wall biosynthesis
LSDLEIQTIQDFEVVLVVFGRGSIDDTSISDTVADFEAGFRERMTIHRSERAERIDALNDVLGEVRGGYVAFLRAEDQVEPGWCASFVDVRSQFPYRVLRCRGAGQFSASGDVQHAPISQSEDIIPLGLDEPSSIAEFALPAGLFRNLGLRFDPRIEDGADWDLVTQSVLFCDMGVSSTPGVAARRTQASAISTSDVPHPKRVSGFSRLAKLNAYPLLLAPGSAVRIRALQAERDELRARLLQLREAIGYPRLRAFLGAYFPEIGDETWRETEQSAAPFLSVITRTRGTRIGPLREALLCLAGQSSQDFELLLVIHNATESDSEKVHALVDEFPSSFRERITVLICNRPGRASPLNDAVARTKGRYVAVLDDDDFVLGHWVETFLELSSRAPGTLLRARCARQDFELSEEDKSCSQARASSWPTLIWPSDFDQIDHLSDNYSPFMSVAFPAEVFRKCQLRFDEALSTTEDWDFIVRTSLLCGVSTSPNVTAIYRWWTNGESSAFLHKREEWVSNRERIIQKIDSHPILLPAGSVARINGLASSLKHMTARSEEYFRELLLKDEQMRQMYALKEEMSREVAELHVILKSRSWRITKPLRAMSELLARGRSSFRARLGNLARALYRGLPLPTSLRLRLKSVIFRTAPFLFRSTAAYQAWSKLNPRDRG